MADRLRPDFLSASADDCLTSVRGFCIHRPKAGIH